MFTAALVNFQGERKMRNKILNYLESKDYISGEKIAKNLNVTRAAVYKQIKILREHGYKIDAKKNKGYKLIRRSLELNPEEITYDLNTEIIGKKVYVFDEVASTNLIAKKLVNKKEEEGTVVVAEIQKKGRGRKNRYWISKKGGLWFSIIVYPNISPQNAMIITMAASVSIIQAIKENLDIDVEIKWPNDIIYKNKKICGILTELDAEIDKINHLIIGIGINVNNEIDKKIDKIAFSLKEIVGKDISKVSLLKSLLRNFDKYYDLINNNQTSQIRNLWIKNSNIIGKKIKVNDFGKQIIGIVKDINENGFIILETKDKTININSGDVEYI